MRNKEYLVAILAEGDILRAETLRFHDELRGPADIGLPERQKTDRRQVSALERAVTKCTTDELSMEEMKDEYAERLRALIERKRKRGEDIIEADTEGVESGDEEEGDVDLLETIRLSLQHANGDSHPPARGPRRQARKRDSLDEQSKDQLYERAKELDMPGRSSMSKRQLVQSIRGRE